MARCVAIVLFLILPGIFSEAVGNIGCLFSETLCNQETEWCYDDYAFGRCLPLYGNMKEENMFRYNLGTGELHALEKEMQRLFQLGYRWSHTYTQCVLQILLTAMQEKSEFDVSSCNSDLDQDLEGALKAIEGEEVEHIDPRNLAIVRFAPSVADPHSNYADEFYFPPLNEILPYRPNEHDELDRKREQAKHSTPSDEEEKGRQSGNGKTADDLSRIIDPPINGVHNVRESDSNSQQKEIQFTPQELAMFINEDGKFKPGVDLNEDGYFPFENEPLVMPLIQKRANILQRRMQQVDMEIPPGDFSNDPIYKKLLRRNPVPNRNLGQIVDMIARMKYGVHDDVAERKHIIGAKIYSAAESDKGGMYDYPDSRFRISEDSYYGRFPSNSFMSGPYKHETPSAYVPYVASYDQPIGSPETSQIPELEPPDKNSVSYISDEIHPRYEPSTPPTFSEEQQAPESNSISDIGKENSPYDSSASRFDDTGRPVDEGGYFLMDSNEHRQNAWPSEAAPKANNNPYQYYGYRYNPANEMNQAPPDYPLYYTPYPQYPDYDYYNDYSAYPNMREGDGGFSNHPIDKEGNGNYELSPNDPYNLERSERFDEKKPGPPFMKVHRNEDSTEGMVLEPESLQGGGDWMKEQMNWNQPYLYPGGMMYDANDLDSEGSVAGSETLQFDEAILDGAVDTSGKQADIGQKERLPTVAKHIGHAEEQEKSLYGNNPASDSYIHITLKGEFSPESTGTLVGMIEHYANIPPNSIEETSVKDNVVSLKLNGRPHGLSPADLAEQIVELRPVILEKTHIEIVKAGVGPKDSYSGVVQQVDDRDMETAAAIVCGICGALLVSATALFVLRRHAKSKAKLRGISTHDTEASKDYQDLCRARMASKTDSKDSSGTQGHAPSTQVATQRISSLSKESENGNNSPSSRSSTSSWSEEPVISNMDISTGHMVLSYMEDHLKNKDRLDQEWVELCSYEAEPCACNIALKGDNAKRNRYQDCVPYDHNRVILNEHININGSSYINASSITDHDPRNPAYIATQGPMTGTSADFWQLVWEQGSVVIVMLTRLTENGQSLCHRYWPEEGSELYHIYEVHLVSEHIWCDDYLVRSFYLKNVRTSETRTVTQFHFLSWPESGTPASTKAILEFRRKVNKSYRGRSCPIILHCSDGVGRTGTYCLIDMVLNRMVKGSKEIDIAATLEHIRDQRPVMVKTKAQFEFVLMAVAEEVHAILKALPQ